MESNQSGDTSDRPQQPEESKNEQLRKIKVKTIDNQVFSLEVPPSVASISSFLNSNRVDPYRRIQERT